MEKPTPATGTNPPPPQSSASTSGVATLSNAVVNLAAIRDLARRQLIDILDSVRNLLMCNFEGERKERACS